MVEPNERMIQWLGIEANLAPDKLRMKMTKEEWKGLTLLVGILDSSKSCTTIEKGRIVATYDREVEVVLLFESMLSIRIEWLSANTKKSLARPDQHLKVIVRRRSTNDGKILQTHLRNQWSSSACVVAREADGLPVTDLAATFVLWADSGFPNEPATLSEQIAFVKRCQTLEDFLEEKRRLRRDSIMRNEMRRRARNLERIRKHQEEEERRLIQDAADELGSMGWRELMNADRELRDSSGGVNQTIRAISKSLLDPEGL